MRMQNLLKKCQKKYSKTPYLAAAYFFPTTFANAVPETDGTGNFETILILILFVALNRDPY